MESKGLNLILKKKPKTSVKKKNLKESNYKEKTILIDGKYLATRTRFNQQLRELSYNGVNTGLYFGFFNSLKMVAKEFKTGNIIIMWEGSSSKGFRKKMFKDYKVNRSKNKSPEEIQEKIEFNKEANEMYEKCLSLGFVGYSLEGYEADDLIAHYCNLHPDEEIIIVSNDEDMYQCLVHDNVTIYNIDKKKKKNKKWFKEEYGIHPDLWVMVKGLSGCFSDGVPGVPGVGEKTAIKYLLGNSSKNINDKIAQYSLDIKRNIELVKIPMDRIKQEDFYFLNKKTNLNKKKFIDLCFELDFRYFLDQITEFDIFCNGGK